MWTGVYLYCTLAGISQFFCRNRSWSMCSGVRVLRRALTMSPAVENTLSVANASIRECIDSVQSTWPGGERQSRETSTSWGGLLIVIVERPPGTSSSPPQRWCWQIKRLLWHQWVSCPVHPPVQKMFFCWGQGLPSWPESGLSGSSVLSSGSPCCSERQRKRRSTNKPPLWIPN